MKVAFISMITLHWRVIEEEMVRHFVMTYQIFILKCSVDLECALMDNSVAIDDSMLGNLTGRILFIVVHKY